jgi:hypothetical protein
MVKQSPMSPSPGPVLGNRWEHIYFTVGARAGSYVHSMVIRHEAFLPLIPLPPACLSGGREGPGEGSLFTIREM